MCAKRIEVISHLLTIVGFFQMEHETTALVLQEAQKTKKKNKRDKSRQTQIVSRTDEGRTLTSNTLNQAHCTTGAALGLHPVEPLYARIGERMRNGPV